jgi:hypothetical protein
MQESYPRWARAQKYAAKGVEALDCFAGQVRIQGKKVKEQPFSVFVPNAEMKCCGRLVKRGQTDDHGHFLVEPMDDGEYFAQFELKGVPYVANFAIISSYHRCDGTHVEIDFSETNRARIQSYVDINDSGEECQENEPRCYRK